MSESKRKELPNKITKLNSAFTALSTRSNYFLIVVYFFICSCCYLISYWNQYSINILPFLGLLDVIFFSFFPLIIFIITILMAVILLDFILDFLKIYEVGFTIYKRQPENKQIIYITLVATFALLFLRKIGFAAVGFSIFMTIPISFALIHYYKSYNRYIAYIIFLVIFLPFGSWNYGEFRANLTVQSKNYIYSDINYEGKKIPMRYLGMINNNFFFFDLTKNLLIIKKNTDQIALILKK